MEIPQTNYLYGRIRCDGKPNGSLFCHIRCCIPRLFRTSLYGLIETQDNHSLVSYILHSGSDYILSPLPKSGYVDVKEAYQLLDGVWFLLVAFLNYTFWFLVGCLCHIAEDLLTGYVPILSPTDERKIHIFFYPGSPNEYIFDLLFTIGCIVLKVPYIHSLIK